MSYGYWNPYVPAARKRAQAAKALARANKSRKGLQPVVIEGRAIARTFWGKAWCANLEAYSDFANRLPRGRTYVRNGAVIDLQIEPGTVKAQVAGSEVYQIEIGIAAVPASLWQSLARQCTGSIASLVELLQGKLSTAVMERICQPTTGLFPAPGDIRLDCSCPDWATMCKHVAAVLYGVGARLDARPELLFTLRQVDADELVTRAAEMPVTTKTPSKGKVLDEALLSDVFGIEMVKPDAARHKAGTPTTRTAPASAAKAKSQAGKGAVVATPGRKKPMPG